MKRCRNFFPLTSTMQILLYAGLEPGKLHSKFNKVYAAIERDDFRSVELKKLAPTPYYRAKLDDASRLLLRFVHHGGQTACLVLEVIAHHAYDKSRFLRGARVDEALITDPTVQEAQASAEAVRYLHPGRGEFHMLEQPISFDDAQEPSTSRARRSFWWGRRARAKRR